MMKIHPRLRKVYDWINDFPQFEACESGDMFDGTQENVVCFTSYYGQAINWRKVEESYLKSKEKIDKILGFKDEPKAAGEAE